ncbi:MAG: PAS domain-containing protein, partial [Gemmatimonadetes bacterium]|nr:PAS domain-containing protein [Gemmatimonadota bacterium]
MSVTPARIPALEALSDGFCMVGPDWRITYWNAAAERMLGTPRAEVLGRPLFGAFPDADEAAVRARLAEGGPVTLGAGVLFAAPVVATAADEGFALQLRAPDPEAERATVLLESIRYGCVGVDADGRLTYANRAARRVLGAFGPVVKGAEIWALLPPAPEVLRRTLRAALEDGRARRLQAVEVEAPP